MLYGVLFNISEEIKSLFKGDITKEATWPQAAITQPLV